MRLLPVPFQRRAARKIAQAGGLRKADPNAVRMSAEDVQKNAAKALEASGDVDASANTSSSDSKRRLEISSAGSDVTSDGASSGEREPAKKRSKILGDLNLNDAEVQQLLNTKSKHAAALTEVRVT